MNQNFITQFIDEMTLKGCIPAPGVSIIADDKWHRFKAVGDRKPNARYQLKIDDGFAVGRWIWFKDGISHRWHSAKGKRMGVEEREAARLRVEKDRAEKDAAQILVEEAARAGIGNLG